MATQEVNNRILEFPMQPEVDSEEEVAEWLEAFNQVVEDHGTTRGCELLDALIERARESGVEIPVQLNTPYVNTIPVDEEVPYPGDRVLERRIKSLIRWNAMAVVHRQNKKDPGIGGRTYPLYSSLATLLEGGRIQSFLPRPSTARSAGRFHLFPRPLFSRRLCPGVSGRPAQRRAGKDFPSRIAGSAGATVLSSPVAVTRFLEFPDGFHGHWTAQCDLPGALHALSGEPRDYSADAP